MTAVSSYTLEILLMQAYLKRSPIKNSMQFTEICAPMKCIIGCKGPCLLPWGSLLSASYTETVLVMISKPAYGIFFPEADCVIYGHTHRPVCRSVAGKLIINPGTFRDTGRFGAKGTYAKVEIGDTLQGKLYEAPTTI